MPMMAPQTPYQSVNEDRFHAVSFVGKLDSGELLTGTPIITEVGSADLTITNKAVNTSPLVINGATVATGMALQFKVAGAGLVANTFYRILMVCSTDAGQVLDGELRFRAI